MKKLLIVVLAILFSGVSMAQSNSDNSVVYQNWKMILESPTHYEVSARVVKCHPDSTVQLHLEIFNEGVSAQACQFKLTITNPVTKEQIVKEVNHTLGVGEMIKPSCDNGDKQSLRFNIPSGWNPATLEFTVTLIP
jgi:hypothetical protein